MNVNSKLSLRDDIAFGVYNLDTPSPMVLATQLSTYNFYFFEDDAAQILGMLLEGASVQSVVRWIEENKEGDPSEHIQCMMEFLEEYASYFFIVDGINREFLPQECVIWATSPDEENESTRLEQAARDGVLEETITTASFELTWDCNVRCRHCYNPTHETTNLLTPDEWFAVIRQLRAEGVSRIILTGGDPLCYPYFWEVAEEIRRQYIAFDVYTNGQILSEKTIAQRLAKLRPRSVQCSLYGVRPETHDFITTVPGSWEKTVQCLKYFKELSIPTVIKMIGMKTNAHELDEMVDFARYIHATLQVDIGLIRKLDGNEEPLALRLDEEAMVPIMNNPRLPLYLLTQHLRKMDFKPIPSHFILCSAGHSTVNIRPDGVVTPCVSFNFPLGNLRETDFETVLRSAEFAKIRSLQRKDRRGKCLDCDIEGLCTFCPASSFAETGDYLSDCSLTCQTVRANIKSAQSSFSLG